MQHFISIFITHITNTKEHTLQEVREDVAHTTHIATPTTHHAAPTTHNAAAPTTHNAAPTTNNTAHTTHISAPTTHNAAPTTLKITCWNCRGLSNSIQYLGELIDDGSDVILLSEHWLWPFDLHRLSDIHPDFMGWGLADSRLTSTSESTRGCGGVGVIWRRNLCCTTISGSDSDRMCGIRIKTKNSQAVLSIIAVYLPGADLGSDYYRECLTELERITEDSKQLGPTVIMGDFNAHLGTLGGPKGCGDPNSQGVLHELLRRSDLFIASLSNHAEGPHYTFWRGDTHTTVDYVLMDVDAAFIMSSCMIHDVACLNTSDHLPLSVTVNVPTDSIELVNDLPTRID